MIAGAIEEDIYEALGLELRARRNCARTAAKIEAAEREALPRLITAADLRGDLHMHTTATDGRADAETMAIAARARRPRRTSRSPITARRWRWPTASTSGARSSTPRGSARSTTRLEGITVLAGIECDIRPDGTMDLADDCLASSTSSSPRSTRRSIRTRRR